MSRVAIKEESLQNLANTIRAKTGSTDKYNIDEAITAINDIGEPELEDITITDNGVYESALDGYSKVTVNCPPAPTAEELIITGDCSYRFSNNGWNWVIDKYGDKITTKDITSLSNAFNGCTNLEEIPLTLNISNLENISSLMIGCSKLTQPPKVRGTFKWSTNTNFQSVFTSCSNLRYADDLFLPEMLDGISTVKVTSAYSCPKPCTITGCYSLRKIPEWWYKFKLNPESTAFPSSWGYSFSYCRVLDEIKNIPVWVCAAPVTSNLFGYTTFYYCDRLKDVTFETNEDGTPITANWKSQIIDLTGIGWAATITDQNFILDYNSGITADKRVYNATTYEALKNDPDWYPHHDLSNYSRAYSRYDKTSAINTINSLPDTSAYLATAGGTNTIKFTGFSGELTDGGAINTMTEEEIAVATAKGWTVTFS